MSSGDLSSLVEAEKITRPSSSMDSWAIDAMRSAIWRSRSVQVGDLNISVSLMMAQVKRPAIRVVGIRPRSMNIPATMVAVEPTGSLRM